MSSTRSKLLAIRLGAMGDVCLLAPVIRALQEFVSVDWLVSERYAPGVRIFPELKCRVIEASADPRAPSPFSDAMVRQLQDERYDYCLDFSHWPDAAKLVARLQDIPVRATTHDPAQDSLLNVNPKGIDLYGPFNRLVEVNPAFHQVQKSRALVEAACGFPLKLSWPMPPRPRPGKTLRVFVQVHASKKIKRWPARYFALALRSLALKRPLHCFVNAFPELYAKRLDWLMTFSGCRVERLPFDPSLHGLRGCLETVDFAIGCDSGPMHLAGLLGVPTVVIYGPYPAREFRPLGRTISVSPPGESHLVNDVLGRDVRASMQQVVADLDSGQDRYLDVI